MTKLELAKSLIEEKTVKGKCTLSKKKLGEVLAKRYPSEFKNAENARTIVRKLTGAQGDLQRKRTKTRIEWKGLSLPEPEKNDYSKFIVTGNKLGVMSDIHLPYYDKKALNAGIKHLRYFGPDTIVLDGDIIDAYHLSRWEKDPRKRSFKYELDMLKAFILELKTLFPKTKIIFVEGNHEARYTKQILQRLPELVDLGLFTFESVIDAHNLGIAVVKDKRLLQAGKLNIGHGHEMPMGISAPVNPARGFFLKTKANFLGGHHHASSTHTESDINDNIIGAWSMGCLCELHPHYHPINKWNHGMATVEIDRSGEFNVNNIKIINGKVL